MTSTWQQLRSARRYACHMLVLLAWLVGTLPAAAQPAAPRPEDDLQGFLAAQPGPLAAYRAGSRSAAQIISGASAYYGISPRLLLALLEASSQLLSRRDSAPQAIERPFGAAAPAGLAEQIDWAAATLRAGLGPYEREPALQFSDGSWVTLTLNQAPEGLAVQRLLAVGRTQREWRAALARFDHAFQTYFNNELPDIQPVAGPAMVGFLRRPWPEGTRVIHLAHFDHAYPTVDTGRRDNGVVVNYLGRGGMQYDGHDGHDFTFPDRPIGTYILAAADGIAYASTHRGNGVWIQHPNGYVTVYWHLDRFAGIFRGLVNAGRGVPVQAGMLIGTSGRSGPNVRTPHLHFEVRHNGRQVDPYGWYGAGPDPCLQYAGCGESTWLWHPELIGEFNFTPPDLPAAGLRDRTPPLATMTLDPDPDLLFLARFDGHALQQVGTGAPLVVGAPGFPAAHFGTALLVGAADRVAFPNQGNLQAETGTIIVWAMIPQQYMLPGNRRNYLFAASANPNGAPEYRGTLALRREIGTDQVAYWNFWTVSAAVSHDLKTRDILRPGLQQIAISWDRTARLKQLYLNGDLVAQIRDADLPTDIGAWLEIGRFTAGSAAGGIAIDELAIYRRALTPAEIARSASDRAALRAERPGDGRSVLIDLNAYSRGGIMAVQVGIDERFGDPVPFADTYRMQIPSTATLLHVRLFDRSGNRVTLDARLPYAARRVYVPLMSR